MKTPAIGTVWRRGLYERHLIIAVEGKCVTTREMDTQMPLTFKYSKQEFREMFWIDDGLAHCDCAECKAIDYRMSGLCGRTGIVRKIA